MREFESIYTGSCDGALVSEEKLKKSRKVSIAEWQHCGDRAVRYLLAYDVSRNEGDENALCALIVFKLTEKSDGNYVKEIVNIFSMEGSHYQKQARFLKEQVDKFKPFMLVIDANAYGGGVVDNLVLDLDDGFPPYGVINDDRYDKYRQPNSLNIVYALKAQGKDTKDSDMITNFMTTFDKMDIGLLKNQFDGLKELKSKIKEKTDDYDLELSLPYILTDLLCEEILNLKFKNTGIGVTEERISARIRKDKYSAVKYGLWLIYKDELENKVKVKENDYSNFFVSASTRNTTEKKNFFGTSSSNPFGSRILKR